MKRDNEKKKRVEVVVGFMTENLIPREKPNMHKYTSISHNNIRESIECM